MKGLNHHLQDFEGQRLAELITTILLSVTGVGYHYPSFALSQLTAKIPSLDIRLHCRLHTTERLHYALGWIGRECNHLPDGGAALANL